MTGVIPNYIINLPDLCIYIQTDNAKLIFENTRVREYFSALQSFVDREFWSLQSIFTVMPRTIVITLNEDLDIESS